MIQGQIDMFEYLHDVQPKEKKNCVRSPGDKIGRVILGECKIGIIKKVDGSPDHPFYRTDIGCFSYEEGLMDIEGLEEIAERNRKEYKTIIPKDLEERITVEYAPRECDGVVLWAQIGIFENMLFWKEDVTYQFCVPFDSEKKLRKEYEKKKKEILDDKYINRAYRFLEKEHEMHRLYWSNVGKCYADAEYVQNNP